jgi:hypothetical protein
MKTNSYLRKASRPFFFIFFPLVIVVLIVLTLSCREPFHDYDHAYEVKNCEDSPCVPGCFDAKSKRCIFCSQGSPQQSHTCDTSDQLLCSSCPFCSWKNGICSPKKAMRNVEPFYGNAPRSWNNATIRDPYDVPPYWPTTLRYPNAYLGRFSHRSQAF